MTADFPAIPASGKRDPIYGTGSTRAERNLARGAALLGTAAVLGAVAVTAPDTWAFWQYALAALVAFDLIGGVVANALGSAQREHERPDRLGDGALLRLVRRPVLFSAVHVQPILVGLLFPGASGWWGVAWYIVVLGAVVVVRRVPRHLARPVALAVAAGVAVATPLTVAPVGFAWLPVIMVLKLVVAHAVPRDVEPHPEGARP